MSIINGRERIMNILLTSVGRRAYIIEYLKEVYKKLGLAGSIIATNSDK